MKTKIFMLLATAIVCMLLIASAASAQQAKKADPRVPSETEKLSSAGNYSFKLYQAPNKAFGYDVWKDGKPVYHQFVISTVSKDNKLLFATQQQAEKAAALAIKKMKKGEPPALSADEIKKAMAVTNE